MKKALGLGMVVGVLALGASDAHASHLNLIGGCGMSAAGDQVAGEGQHTGEIDIAAVAYYDDLVRRVTTITCYITVNGYSIPGSHVSASGVVVLNGGGIVSYSSYSENDDVQLCQQVDNDPATCTEIGTVGSRPLVTAILCEAIEILAPGVGPVIIDPADYGC